jgi:hypothetical protein
MARDDSVFARESANPVNIAKKFNQLEYRAFARTIPSGEYIDLTEMIDFSLIHPGVNWPRFL